MNTSEHSPVWLRVLAFSVSALLALLFLFILSAALYALWLGRDSHLLGATWNPRGGRFGILPMIHATLLLSLSASFLGWLCALGCACALQIRQNVFFRGALLALLRFMTAIPTVVYGFASVFLLVPLVRNGLGGSGFSLLTAALVLALQGVPAMVLIMHSAMDSARQRFFLTSASLGMSPLQHLLYVVFPSSKKGLAAAAVLGFGRAVGDTLLPTMLAGNAVQFASSPLDALRTLTAHIGLVLASEVGGGENLSLLLSGGVLLLLSSCVHAFSRFLLRSLPRESA